MGVGGYGDGGAGVGEEVSKIMCLEDWAQLS